MGKIGKVGVGTESILCGFLKTAAPNPPPGQAGKPKDVIPAGGQPAPAQQVPQQQIQPAAQPVQPIASAQQVQPNIFANVANEMTAIATKHGFGFVNKEALAQFLRAQFEANASFGTANLAGKPRT